MKKIVVVCSPGVGDALILHVASHHLALAGFCVTTVSPHRFGQWLPSSHFENQITECDALFLQHDNTTQAEQIRAINKPVYTFYGSHTLTKHGPLRSGYDYVCDPNRTMVDNMMSALQILFRIPATSDNGLRPLPHLLHRRYKKRVAIHTHSALPAKNWPLPKFTQVAAWLAAAGYDPVLLPQFPSLEELVSFIYESGYFVGNDSGPGHIASCLHIPHLIIGRSARHMRFWRPGWLPGAIVTPPSWIPNFKGWRIRENYWQTFVGAGNVIKKLKTSVLNN